MLIEFIGLPGSGKSTIHHALLKEIEPLDNHYLSSEEAFYRIACEHIDRPLRYPVKMLPKSKALAFLLRLSTRSLMQYEAQNRYLAVHGHSLKAYFESSIYQDMSINDRSIVIGHFLQSASIHECIDSFLDKSLSVISDEGLLQKTFMFVDHSDRANDANALQQYLQHIPLPKTVIFVKADLALCKERMINRPRGLTDRLKHASDDAITQFLNNSEAHLNTVKDWLQKNTSATMIEIDSEQSIKHSVEKIVSSILVEQKSL